MTFWADYDKKRIGKGNPYWCCKGCGRSDPEINGDIKRHGAGCSEVQKYLAELNPNDYTPVMVDGCVMVTADEYDYEIVMDGREVYIKLVNRNLYGLFYPLGKPEVTFSSALIATETFRDAVGLMAAKAILQDAGIPRSHVLWKLGSKG
jgi:hypothetical protein